MATMVREGIRRISERVAARPGTRNINLHAIERIASIAGGGTLAFLGIRRHDVPGAVMALAGGVLVERGATGYDPIYGALGMSTAGALAKPVRVRHSVTVARPPEQVYAFLRNFDNLPRVMTYLDSVRPLGGDRYEWRVKGMGGRVISWEVRLENDVPNEQIS